jgi:hypothetical protein
MDVPTRARKIVTEPVREWRTIAAEPAGIGSLLRDYAAPLSAIPAVCGWLGGSIIGYGFFRVGLVRGFANAVVSWIFGLIGCWLAAIVVEKLAPRFESRGSTVQALKLVVYAATPVWLAGILNLIPALAVLVVIAALYALYLYYVGLPIVMQTPADKVIPFMATSAVVVVVVMVIAGTLASAVTGIGRMAAF